MTVHTPGLLGRWSSHQSMNITILLIIGVGAVGVVVLSLSGMPALVAQARR